MLHIVGLVKPGLSSALCSTVGKAWFIPVRYPVSFSSGGPTFLGALQNGFWNGVVSKPGELPLFHRWLHSCIQAKESTCSFAYSFVFAFGVLVKQLNDFWCCLQMRIRTSWLRATAWSRSQAVQWSSAQSALRGYIYRVQRYASQTSRTSSRVRCARTLRWRSASRVAFAARRSSSVHSIRHDRGIANAPGLCSLGRCLCPASQFTDDLCSCHHPHRSDRYSWLPWTFDLLELMV